MLENHFTESHADLINKTIRLPSPLLLPLWKPFFPTRIEPPPIPTPVPPGSALILPVEGSWRARPRTPQRAEAPQIGSPKRRKPAPQIPDTKPDVEREEEQEEFVFEDLPKQLDENLNYKWNAEQECIIQSLGPPVDVARPQPILDPNIFGYRVAQKTILYDAFVELHIAEWGTDDDDKPEDSQVTVTEARYHPSARQGGTQIANSSGVPSKADN